MRTVGIVAQSAVLAAIILMPGSAPAQEAAPRLVSLTGTTSGDEGDGFAFATLVENAPPPLLYTWDFGDGTPPVVKMDTAGMNHRYAEDGDYKMTVTVEGVGTTVSGELAVVVKPARPKIHLLLVERDPGDEKSFHFTAEVEDPGENDELTYTWDYGDGTPPEKGVDLVETHHRYEREGGYTVTLTVEDEDELAATETRRVLIGNAVEVRIEGDLNTILQTGNGPTSVCPVPLGNGGCGLNLQYWDDKNRSYLFLQLYGNPLLEPREYPILYAADRTLVEGVPVPEATGIVSGGWDPDSYEMYKGFMQVTECRNASMMMPSVDMKDMFKKGGLKGLGKSVLGPLGGLLGGKKQSSSAPTGAGYAAASGRLEMIRADEERVGGKFTSHMTAKRDGALVSVDVEGVFSAVFDEFADKFLALCEPGPFKISGRFPDKDAKRVDFDRPDVWVSLTRPLAPESISTDAVWLETKNASGQFERVPVRLLHDSERHRVHLLPITGLDPARFYQIRVASGESGLKSRTGEKLQGDESWQFATMPDLYRKAEGGGGSIASAPPPAPRVVPAVLRGRPGMTPAEYALRSAEASRVVPAQTIGLPGGDAQEPNVECATFQTTRNMPLVQGKPTAFRVYLDWKLPDSSKAAQVTEVEASVTIVDGQGNSLPGLSPLGQPQPFQHRSVWKDDAAVKRAAAHTANFSGWLADPAVADVIAKATIVDAKGKKHTFEGRCPVGAWGVANSTLKIGFFLLPVGAWENDSPFADEIAGFVRGSVDFLRQNFPVAKVTAEIQRAVLKDGDKSGPFKLLELPETSPDSPVVVLNKPTDMMLRLRDAVRAAGLRYDVTVALYPPDVPTAFWETSKWKLAGYNYSRPNGQAAPDPLFPEIMVRVLREVGNNDGSVTLAHEVAHSFGLYHVPPKDELMDAIEAWSDGEGPDPFESPWRIEGLRIASDGSSFANKSKTEGNGEANSILPLLFPLQRERNEIFVTDANYVGLLKEMKKYFESSAP